MELKSQKMVSIEPFLNRSNRTFMELKLGESIRAMRTAQVLIVPLWN